MRQYVLSVLAGLFLFVPHLQAGMLVKPSLSTQYLTGVTWYDITFGGYDPTYIPGYGALGYFNAESKLEFDINAILERVGLDFETSNGILQFGAGYSFSVAKGSGELRDRDWLTNDYVNNVQGYDALGGDTLSDTESPVMGFDIGMKARLLNRKGVRLYGLWGYEYQKLGTFWVYDIRGYYRGWMTDGVNYTVNQTYLLPVLSYEITYNTLKAGFSAEFEMGGGFSFAPSAQIGRGSYSDLDDHILRRKLAKSSGSGLCMDFQGDFSWRSRSGFGLSAFARYKSLSGTGHQTQMYYDGSDVGTFALIDHEVKSTQLSFGLDLSYKFGKAGAAKKTAVKPATEEPAKEKVAETETAPTTDTVAQPTADAVATPIAQ
jgi:hypothetical protein